MYKTFPFSIYEKEVDEDENGVPYAGKVNVTVVDFRDGYIRELLYFPVLFSVPST